MSLSKIGRQRRGLKQKPWIIDNILNKTGKRKQRPETVDVLKHVRRPSDGSFVREVSDGQVYITAIFSNVAVKTSLEEHDGFTPPEWDRALLLVTQYSIEFQHKNLLNECEYVLHIESFKIWDLQEGFERKKKLFFCMEDVQVREKAKHHWEEIRKQEMEANNTNVSINMTDNSISLTQLLDEMAKDDSQMMDNNTEVDLTAPEKGVDSKGFTFPSKMSLDRKFDTREFIISKADSEILDSITEWKYDYCPPINEDKTSFESTPNITSKHTLRGDISSEEAKTDDHDMESIHLSCSDPAEERKTGNVISQPMKLVLDNCEAGMINGTNNKKRTPTKGRELLNFHCADIEDGSLTVDLCSHSSDFKENEENLINAVSIYPESQPFIPRFSPVEQKSEDNVDKQQNSEIENVSLKSTDSFINSTQPFDPVISPVNSLEIISEDVVNVQQKITRRNIFREEIQIKEKCCAPSLASDDDNLMVKDLHSSKMPLSPVRIVLESPARKKRKVENLCCKEIENSVAVLEDSFNCDLETMDGRTQNCSYSGEDEGECTKIKTRTLDRGKNYTGNSVSSEDVVMATENSYSPDNSVQENTGNKIESGKKKAVFKWKNKNISQVSWSEDSPNESLEGLMLVSPGVWENDEKQEQSPEQEQSSEQEQFPEQEQSPEQEQLPEQEHSSEQVQSSEQEQSPDQEQSPEQEQSPVVPKKSLSAHPTDKEGNEIILISSEESFTGIEERHSSRSRHTQSLKETNKNNLPSKTIPHDSLCNHLDEQSVNKTTGYLTENDQRCRKSQEQLETTRYSSSGSEIISNKFLQGTDSSRTEENSHDIETTSQIKKKMLDSIEEYGEEDKLNIHFPESLLCQMIDYFTNTDSNG